MSRKWIFAALIPLLAASAVPLLAGQNTSPLLRPGAISSGLTTTTTSLQRIGASAPAAGYAVIEGTKQGAFKGTAMIKGLENSIPIQRFDYEVSSPRDVATGQATGKRQHKPIRIVKEWDAASPMLFQALCTNEQIKTAKFSFYRANTSGQMELFQVVTLSGAAISSIKQFTGDPTVNLIPKSALDTARFEEISFVFQRIEIENKPGGTLAMDDFQAAR